MRRRELPIVLPKPRSKGSTGELAVGVRRRLGVEDGAVGKVEARQRIRMRRSFVAPDDQAAPGRFWSRVARPGSTAAGPVGGCWIAGKEGSWFLLPRRSRRTRTEDCVGCGRHHGVAPLWGVHARDRRRPGPGCAGPWRVGRLISEPGAVAWSVAAVAAGRRRLRPAKPSAAAWRGSRRKPSPKAKSHAALLRGAAAVVGDRGVVLDRGDLDAVCLEGRDGGLATGAGAAEADLDLGHAEALRLLAHSSAARVAAKGVLLREPLKPI